VKVDLWMEDEEDEQGLLHSHDWDVIPSVGQILIEVDGGSLQSYKVIRIDWMMTVVSKYEIMGAKGPETLKRCGTTVQVFVVKA
jgi:hypothetical protein